MLARDKRGHGSSNGLTLVLLQVETFFNDVIEPGTGSAVDMEVARVDGKWQIVQALIIGMDK